MLRRDKTVIEIPSYFNVFHVDKLHLKTFDASIFMRFCPIMHSDHDYLSIPAINSA